MGKQKFNYAWIIFIGCCFMSFVGFGLVVNTPGLYFASLTKELSVDRTEIAMTLTLSSLAGALTLMFAGKIFAKVNTKLLLSICVLVCGGGFILNSTFHSILPFYIVSTLMGIASTFAIGLCVPVLLGNWFEKKLGLAMGIAMGLTGFGGAFFNPLISSIIMNHGWRTAYLTSGMIILICLLPFTLFVLRYKPNADKGEIPYGKELNAKAEKAAAEEVLEGIPAKNAYRTPSFYLFLMTIISLNMVAGLVQHVSGHIVNIGYALTVGASVISGIMLGAAVGKILMGILLDLLSPNLVITLYTLVGITGWGGLIWFHGATALVASGFMLGLGQAILLVSIPYLVRKTFGPREYSQIFSIISMFGSFASAISATLGGVLFDKTGSYTLSISANLVFYVIASLSILTAYSLKRKIVFVSNEIKGEKIV
ncbi:MFS transporter [Neobacillus vireti]|uniref:MFS transporter n=1 Tax=Neobacillus vireti TaxID=220686 RepID=UPI002FFFF444